MTVKVDEGSIWASSDRKQFQVIKTCQIDNNIWVYYREYASPHAYIDSVQEYSCYLESFVHRFSPVVK
jgi:hypothetical protein